MSKAMSPGLPSSVTVRLRSAAAAPLAVLVAIRLAYLLCHPPRQQPRREPARYGLDPQKLRIDVTSGQGRLSAWLCRGNPEQVVVLGHGIGLEKSRGLPQAAFLNRAGYTVVLFDFRNHGGSFADRGIRRFSQRFVDDVIAVITCVRAMTEYADARIALYGFSFSSFAMLYALTRLNGVIDAVICDGGPGRDPCAAFQNLLRAGTPRLPAALRSQPALTWLEQMYRWLTMITMGSPPDWPPSPRRPGYDTTPMLFIVGGDDAIVPEDEVRALASPYPGAELMVVPRAGHLRTMLMDPDRYAAAVLEFLARTVGTGRRR